MAGTAAENGWVPWSVVRRAIGGVVEIPRTAGLMVLGAWVVLGRSVLDAAYDAWNLLPSRWQSGRQAAKGPADAGRRR